MDEIPALRRRIDELDAQLVSLLNARAACAMDIGRVKRQAAIPVYQPDREAEVLAHVCAANRGPLSGDAVKRVFERIIDEARRLERLAPEPPDPAPARQGPER